MDIEPDIDYGRTVGDSKRKDRWTVGRKADEPYQKLESDSPYWIVPTPDGKFSVQAYLKPSRTVLDELTQRQAERLQVYLTELMDDYNKLNNMENRWGRKEER